MSTTNAQQPGGTALLNPARRPQRLYAKVEIAMKVVDKKLEDETRIGEWLSDEEMVEFRRSIRMIIRADYDANFDAWPRGMPHDYVPDARRAIVAAIAERLEDLFNVSKGGNGEHYDDFVEADLLLSNFHTE
ncbi:hypothetical protein LQW54_007102 [Pestalotiopsis sp. IQ-011]